MAAQIGFHGSSIKRNAFVMPAMQVVLGGGVSPEGAGFVAERVIKVPTKRAPDALRLILNDYEENAAGGEYFNDYFNRRGKKYFYTLLKPLADLTEPDADLLFDWGQDRKYVQNIGVGECAGVAFDMVGTILADARERFQWANEAFKEARWADAIYHAYSVYVVGAKGLLLAKDVACNTHKGILDDFQNHYPKAGENFAEKVLAINKNEPSETFAQTYVRAAGQFLKEVLQIREKQLADAGEDRLVVENYYKA